MGTSLKTSLTIKLPLALRVCSYISRLRSFLLLVSVEIVVIVVWVFCPSHISASAGSWGRGVEASDGVFGYVNSHRQKLVETSGGSKGERVFAFRELAEMYIFGGRWWDRQVCTRGHPNSRDCCVQKHLKWILRWLAVLKHTSKYFVYLLFSGVQIAAHARRTFQISSNSKVLILR